MKQGGIYTLRLTETLISEKYDCEVIFDNQEEHDEIAWLYLMPIWAAVLIILGLYVLHGVYKMIMKSREKKKTNSEATEMEPSAPAEYNDIEKKNETAPVEPVKPPVKKRLVSLDTFRGISLALMVFVNFGGGDYWFFEHAPWDGLTMADLMMPWFLFMAGVSIRFGIKSRLKRASSKWHIAWEILVRTAKLSFLGICIVSSSSHWDRLRLPGRVFTG